MEIGYCYLEFCLIKNAFKMTLNNSIDRITPKILGFCHLLREEGFNTGIDETFDALTAAYSGLMLPKDTFRYTLRSLVCSSREEFERFDFLFENYWSRHASYRQKPTLKQISRPSTMARENHSLLMTGRESRETAEEEGKKVSGASALERLRKTDFSKLPPDELEKLDELVQQLWKQMNRRITRRRKNDHRRGQVNLRRTIRRNIAYGGEPIQLAFRSRKQTRPRLVVLLDVSGSMDQYSFFFLKFVYALQKHFEQVESFIFSTRLLHITEALKGNGLAHTLNILSEQAEAWSSGTKIGECLRTFNLMYAKRVLARNSIVVILSDGLDTGEPETFREELHKIKRRTRKLIWLNPLLGMEGYKPLTRGLNAALPVIDVFIPAHNLESLLALEGYLSHV